MPLPFGDPDVTSKSCRAVELSQYLRGEGQGGWPGPTVPLARCVTLGRSLYLSVPQLCHLADEANHAAWWA